tara:strand:+ start:434 stop:691 length:258 start_codon:yes stop_codon:yes gene_type:complete
VRLQHLHARRLLVVLHKPQVAPPQLELWALDQAISEEVLGRIQLAHAQLGLDVLSPAASRGREECDEPAEDGTKVLRLRLLRRFL